MKLLDLTLGSDAVFSGDRRFRFALHRRWDISRSLVAFIGLNPSTADEEHNDPTVSRCVGFAKRWGYGGLIMLNAFAFRATDPEVMKREPEATGGPFNDEALLVYSARASLVIAAWGVGGAFAGRGPVVRQLLKRAGITLHVLGLTKGGHPKHPLYLSSKLEARAWEGA